MDHPLSPITSERDVLQALGTPVAVIDTTRTVRWFNRAAGDAHGWVPSRDAGRPLAELIPTLGTSGVAEIAAALRAGRQWSGRALLPRADGTTYPALLTCVPLHDGTGTRVGLVATASDLTDVEQVERRFLSGYQHSPFGWAFYDLEGRITHCNARLGEILGVDPEAAVRRRPEDFSHPGDHGARVPFEAMRRGESDPTFTTAKRIVRADGSVRWVRVHAQLISDHAGRPEFFSGQIEDITELLASLAAAQSAERGYKELFGQAVRALGAALEARDPYTAGHQHRVADLCAAIARQLGMPADEAEGLAVCAEMHDIGKVAVPAEILTKPGRLHDVEYRLAQRHAVTGHGILEGIAFPWPVARAVREHHERLDGSGYPTGLVGDDICTEARILAVADTVETIASHRPYRQAKPVETALQIVADGAGTLFDPDIVAACTQSFADGYALPRHAGSWNLLLAEREG